MSQRLALGHTNPPCPLGKSNLSESDFHAGFLTTKEHRVRASGGIHANPSPRTGGHQSPVIKKDGMEMFGQSNRGGGKTSRGRKSK